MALARSTAGGPFWSSSSGIVMDLDVDLDRVVCLCRERKWMLQWSGCLCMQGNVLVL